MASTASALIARLDERARREPEFARVLTSLLDTPTSPAGELHAEAAKALNRGRREMATAAFQQASLTTAQVQHLLELGTPQAVHGRHARGKLLGLQIGNHTWFPAWQFDLDEGRPRVDLTRILDLLRRFTTDAIAADRVMRLDRPELGGSISDALTRREVQAHAWNILESLGS